MGRNPAPPISDGWKPINIGINHLSTGAGFLPQYFRSQIPRNCPPVPKPLNRFGFPKPAGWHAGGFSRMGFTNELLQFTQIHPYSKPTVWIIQFSTIHLRLKQPCDIRVIIHHPHFLLIHEIPKCIPIIWAIKNTPIPSHTSLIPRGYHNPQ